MLGVIVLSTIVFSCTLHAALAAWRRVVAPQEAALVGPLAAATNAGAHGLIATVLATWLLATSDWLDFDAANTRAEEMALSMSLGYFVSDTFVYIIPFTPGEWIYVAHHAVSAVFLAASLHLGKGAHACLFGMWIGEVTNPVFHVYNILNALRKRRPRVQAAFRLWAPLFTALFIFTRTLAGPLVSWWWCRKVLLEVDAPLAHKACWIFVSVTIVAVSQPFSLQFWRDTQQLLAAAPPPPPRRPRRRPAKLEASIYDSARDMFAMLRDSD